MALLLALVVLILSVIAHEVAHGYAADALGDPTARLEGRLTLNPVPHIDLMGSVFLPALLIVTHSPILFGWARPVPYNPYNLSDQRWGEMFVALAGSGTNLLLALIFGLFVRFGPLLELSSVTLSFAATIAFINLFLGLFNLIPFPPLDGFTALRAGLPWHLSDRFVQFERSVAHTGIFVLLIFLIVFSYLFAEPFFRLVLWLFALITGNSIDALSGL